MPLSPLKRFRIPLAISSWLSFAIALTFYCITVDPSVSYWDCAEYVTVASRMEVGHPPGNPIWMLAMRIATIPFSPENHALVINVCSGILMAFAVFFLCRVIFIPVRLWLTMPGRFHKNSFTFCNLLASIVALGASLCFALCDSVWFSAVEAEVYAMSTFLSSLSLWIMVRWWWEDSKPCRTRLLVLLAYITGLSLGVHQLNLLLIPVFTLIVFYKNHPEKVMPLRVFFRVVLSVGVVAIIIYGAMPGILFGAQTFELFSVNYLGFPYHSGVIIFCTLVFLLIITLLMLVPAVSKKAVTIWMCSFIWLGYFSFGIILLRANAYPAMNEGVPDNVFSLASYIARDQYGSTPLLYGSTPYSRPMLEESFKDGNPSYTRYILEKGKPHRIPLKMNEGEDGKDVQIWLNHRSRFLSASDSVGNNKVVEKGKGYVLADFSFSQMLTPELNMWLPRITSRKSSDITAYEDWAGMTKENMDRVMVSETIDSLGNYVPRMYHSGNRPEVFSYRPTYTQNLRFFLAYQSYYMYFRYLFWNFIGRQNDFHSMGEVEHGNFITGFPFLDNLLPGENNEMPPEIAESNKGRNRYFGIPFIFGIIGILFLAFLSLKGRRLLTIIGLLFLMTGLAIVVYLNQSPGEPRERDYTFLMSYMAFSMWIAAGFTAFSGVALKWLTPKWALGATSLFALGVPALMAAENFDDHDRRGRFQPTFFVSSYLDFEYPSIIFTQGDNFTFPVWYASEVLAPQNEIWNRHTPVDVSYLSLPSYVINLKKQGSKGISTLASSHFMEFDGLILTRIPHDTLSPPLPIKEALQRVYSSGDSLLKKGEMPAFPSSAITLPAHGGDTVVVNLRKLSGGSSFLPFKQLMLLDILASQLDSSEPKALFFPHMVGRSFHKALESALEEIAFGYIYAPWLSGDSIAVLRRGSAMREVEKLNKLNQGWNYIDPLIADFSVRYREEMLLLADLMMEMGDTTDASTIIDPLLENFSYDSILPGTFTLGDSTFYEGKEASRILRAIYDYTHNEKYIQGADSLENLMNNRHMQWKRYYNSLPKEQKANLSNRSRRLLSPP